MRLPVPFQSKLSYLLSGLVIALALFASQPVDAQDAATAECDVNVAGLQLWYMALDPDNTIAVQFIVAINSQTKVSDKFKALETIQERVDEISAMEHPPCMETAVAYYLDGIGVFITALESFIDSDMTNFVSQQATAMQLIGQFRGYVAAYGVELYETDTGTIYLK